MTRRSNQMTTSVLTSRKTKTSSAFTSESHQGVSLKSACGLSAAGKERPGPRRRRSGCSCGTTLGDSDDGAGIDSRTERMWLPAEFVGSSDDVVDHARD